MFLFRKRKEKPLTTETEFELCKKAIYTGNILYTPWRLEIYKKHIVLDICCTNSEAEEQVKHFVTELSDNGERHLPLEVDGVGFYWDTVDKALRIKGKPEGEGVALIPQVLIYPNDVMTMDKEFAEKYYSKYALTYAEFDGDKYIWNFADGSASPVVFETPKLFQIFIPDKDGLNTDIHMLSGDLISVMNRLYTFTESYAEAVNLTGENAEEIYKKNFEKGKTED